MKHFYQKILILLLLATAPSAQAINTFHPEGDAVLLTGEPWLKVSFENNQTRSIFRTWLPFNSQDMWKLLIDTNAWEKIHPNDYADSRSLSADQFNLAVAKNPPSISAFYELIGSQEYPSFEGRKVGGQWNSYALQRFNLPWPLKDRWVVTKAKNDETNAHQGEYRYDYKSAAGNFKELKGYWEVVPVPGKPGWSEWRGDYKSHPGVEIPNWLARNILKSSLKRTIEEDIKALEGQGAKKAD